MERLSAEALARAESEHKSEAESNEATTYLTEARQAPMLGIGVNKVLDIFDVKNQCSLKLGKKGKLFVISAPSGSGKTTLCQKLILNLSDRSMVRQTCFDYAQHPSKHREPVERLRTNTERSRRKLIRSISVTTRRMRKGEREGRDYFFISPEEFIKRRKARQFLEWAEVLGNFYGTPRAFVERHINRGDDILLSIDVQGARKIKTKVSEAVFIFILPPSVRELARRLRKRSTESKVEIARRLKLAKEEMECVKEYNYLVVNDKISRALRRLKQIIRYERNRIFPNSEKL